MDIKEDNSNVIQTYSFARGLKYYHGGSVEETSFVSVQHACIVEAGRKKSSQMIHSKETQFATMYASYLSACRSLYEDGIISRGFFNKL